MSIPFVYNPMGMNNTVKWSKLTSTNEPISGTLQDDVGIGVSDKMGNSFLNLSNDSLYYGNINNSIQLSTYNAIIAYEGMGFCLNSYGLSINAQTDDNGDYYPLTLTNEKLDENSDEMFAVQLEDLKYESGLEMIALNKDKNNPNYVACLSDSEIERFFNKRFEMLNEKYLNEINAHLDVKLSKLEDAVFEAAVPSYNYAQNASHASNTAWAQQKYDPNIPSIRKIGALKHLTPYFRYVGSDEDTLERRNQGDDYLKFPLFQDFYCNYVYDKNGNRRVVAIKDMCDGVYKESGNVDVGIISPAFWVKVKEVFTTLDELCLTYPTKSRSELQKLCVLENGVYGIKERVFGMTLKAPVTEEEKKDWHYWSAGVRHNGEKSPFMVHTPYLASNVGGKYRSQPFKDAIDGVSYNIIMNFYNGSGYKGDGYKGCSIELYSWAILNMIIKYAHKSSQLLAWGVGCVLINNAIWYKQNKECSKKKTLAVSKNYIGGTDNGHCPIVGNYVAISKTSKSTPAQNNFLMSNKNLAITINDKLMCHALITDMKVIDDTIYYTFDELPEDFVFEYDKSDLFTITYAYSMSAMTKIVGQKDFKGGEIYKFDGCVGKTYKAYFSPWRLRLCEFGQGLLNLMTDIVGVGTGSGSDVYVRPKDCNVYNTYDTIVSNYIKVGKKSNSVSYPSDFDFLFGNGDTPTEDGKHLNACYYPTYSIINQNNGNENKSWGDYYWTTQANNTAYEFMCGGDVSVGPRGGLCYVDSANLLRDSHWTRVSRD